MSEPRFLVDPPGGDAAVTLPPVPPVVYAPAVRYVCFRPDGKAFAAASRSELEIWSTELGVRMLTSGRLPCDLEAIAWSSDARWLATAGDDGAVVVRDLGTGGPGLTFTGSRPTALAFSRDARSLVVGDLDGSVSIYELPSGQLARTFKPHEARIRALDVCEPLIASVGEIANEPHHRSVDIRDPASRTPLLRRGYVPQNIASQVRFSADGHRILVAAGKRVDVWDVTTETRTWSVGEGRLVCATWASEEVVRTSFGPSEAKVFIGAPGMTRLEIVTGQALINDLAVGPDGGLLIGCEDGACRLVDIATGALRRDFVRDAR